jgi:hypothetical protein
MPDMTRVEHLLDRYEQLQEQGQPVTPEELCRESPELLDEVRRQIQDLEALNARLRARGAAEERPTPLPATVLHSPEQARASLAAPPAPPQAGGRLGNYELLEELGHGGMGVVFRARHTLLRKEVALKVLSPELTRSPEAVARFHQEIEAAGRLEHAHLLRASDAGAADGVHYLVTELLAGEDLGRLTARLGRWPVADACEAARQAALGLAHAHAAGLVHRDVKPGNLMLTADGVVKVLDLGLARLQGRPDDRRLTEAGEGMGTADYCPPEQFLDSRTADARSDLYSLGCTLFHLLAGEPPFGNRTHPTRTAKCLAHLNEAAPDVRSRRPEVPEQLAALVARLLAKRPEDRPGSAAEVAAELERVATGADLPGLVPGAGTPPAANQPRTLTGPGARNRAVTLWGWLALAVGGLAVAGLVAGVLLWGGRLSSGPPAPTTVPPPSPPLAVRTFQLDHVVNADGRLGLRGPFGLAPPRAALTTAYGATVNDRVVVAEIEFSEPAYAYLLAFNPNPDPNKREEIWPKAEQDRRPRRQRQMEPVGGWPRYVLDDGPGLQVFAVVASRQPLPPYSEWVRRRGDVGWRRRTGSTLDVVWVVEGGTLRDHIKPEGARGQEEPPAEKEMLQELLGRLRSAPGIETASLVAFTVEPRR